MDLKIGDKVKFKKSSTLAATRQQQGKREIGTILEIYENLPAQGSTKIDIAFADGKTEYGISVNQIELC